MDVLYVLGKLHLRPFFFFLQFVCLSVLCSIDAPSEPLGAHHLSSQKVHRNSKTIRQLQWEPTRETGGYDTELCVIPLN